MGNITTTKWTTIQIFLEIWKQTPQIYVFVVAKISRRAPRPRIIEVN